VWVRKLKRKKQEKDKGRENRRERGREGGGGGCRRRWKREWKRKRQEGRIVKYKRKLEGERIIRKNELEKKGDIDEEVEKASF
jgi:hypothetical protein